MTRMKSTVFPRPVLFAALACLGALLLDACGNSSPGRHADAYTEFSAPGPYVSGTEQIEVNGDPVVVWYPADKASVVGLSKYTYHLRSWVPPSIADLVPSSFADGVEEDAYRDVPMAKGSFPVVLFSHGYGGYPEQSTFLTAHLATWGMIVVAPDQQQRDLSAVILGRAQQVEPQADVTEQLAALAYVKKQNLTSGSLFFDHVDASEVATLGHSAGGGTAVSVAAADPSIRGWIALAGVPQPLPSKPVPSLMMSGSYDKTVPTSDVEKFYDSVTKDKRLIVIDGYGHNVFDDVCTVNHAHGGVTAAIKSLNLPVPPGIAQLATDGCEAPDAYPPTAWPLIDQTVTAQLRFDFGESSSPVGLGPSLDTAFGRVRAHYQASS